MNSLPRLIVCLSIISEDAVKTRSFANPKYLGDPMNLTRLLSKFEVDELMILDISERFKCSKIPTNLLNAILESAFMPVSFGGGVTDFDTASQIFQIGFDKVVLKSGLSIDGLAENISNQFGSQSVIGCLDVRVSDKNLEINGRRYNEKQVVEHVKELEKRGIGELLVHDIENEGTRNSFGLTKLAEIIANSVEIPVIVGGGISGIDEAALILKNSQLDAVMASTMFVLDPTTDTAFVSYPNLSARAKMLGRDI